MASPTKYVHLEDQITSFLICKNDKNAEIYTTHPSEIKKINTFIDKYPNEIDVLEDNKEKGIKISVPKTWIQFKRPKQYNEQERAKRAEIMREVRKKRKNNKKEE